MKRRSSIHIGATALGIAALLLLFAYGAGATGALPSIGAVTPPPQEANTQDSVLNAVLLWSVKTEDKVRSSPALGPNGHIYVGSLDGKLYSVAPDGAVSWTFVTADAIHSSPFVDESGAVYVGSDDGRLYAVDAGGAKLWCFNTRSSIRSSPAVAPDGTVYAGAFSGRLYTLNPDGTRKWQFNIGAPVLSSHGCTGTPYTLAQRTGGSTPLTLTASKGGLSRPKEISAPLLRSMPTALSTLALMTAGFTP